MALPPILQVQRPTAAVRASQQQKTVAAAYRGPSNPRPVSAPIITTARAQAAAGRAQIPYQHPQAPNPTTIRQTGKPPQSAAQRLALVLALTGGHPADLFNPNSVKGAAQMVGGAASVGVERLVDAFNPKLSQLPSPIVSGGKDGGMYFRNAARPDSLPQRASATLTAPLPNMRNTFGLRPQTRPSPPMRHSNTV